MPARILRAEMASSVLIEFVSDPDVPPLPPHISWAQAYMTALAKSDPDEKSIIVQTLRDMLAGIVPD
jgi:pyruvate dehydrogenase (quinone)